MASGPSGVTNKLFCYCFLAITRHQVASTKQILGEDVVGIFFFCVRTMPFLLLISSPKEFACMHHVLILQKVKITAWSKTSSFIKCFRRILDNCSHQYFSLIIRYALLFVCLKYLLSSVSQHVSFRNVNCAFFFLKKGKHETPHS